MRPAQLGHRHATFSLTQDREDLFIGAYAAPSGATVPSSSVYLLVFIQNLLMHLAEKILLIQPLTFREDYRRRVVDQDVLSQLATDLLPSANVEPPVEAPVPTTEDAANKLVVMVNWYLGSFSGVFS